MKQQSLVYNTLLNKNATHDIQHIIDIALQEARKSTCRKSHRGVVITDHTGIVIGQGHNEPFSGNCVSLLCYDPESKFDICASYASHAEERALRYARLRDFDRRLGGGTLYHLKVNAETGEPEPSGTPSCARCAHQIDDANLRTVVLLNELEMGRHAVYGSHDFILATLANVRAKARAQTTVER